MQAKVSTAASGQNARVSRACAARSPVKQLNSSFVRSQQVATKVAFADTAEAVRVKEEPQKRYILGELLGSGTAAHVHVGTDTATGLQHAVKILPKRKGTKDKTKLIKAEIQISNKLRNCRHAVQTVDTFEDERHIYVVQELCCGGDLADLMTAQEGKLSQQEAATIMRCVLEFLQDCHARSICYGDVKPNNFVLRSLYPSIAHLLDPSKPRGALEVVAVDFGCCQELGETCLQEPHVTGTPLYMAPEDLRGCHGLEVDIWAAGVMLYQLLSDRFPFWDVDLHQIDSLGGMAIREGIMHGPVLFPLQPWATEVHPSAQDLIMRMLQRDPQKRISAADALAHPFFAHALGAAPAAASAR